uniref:sensor domain-containing diguanylate cyclase n=1 Tax=Pseudomonas laurentiana TaxID=2364649 RepID=UPI0029C75842|nr:diguanylate cyclase [Pseudomonas laurentiana]
MLSHMKPLDLSLRIPAEVPDTLPDKRFDSLLRIARCHFEVVDAVFLPETVSGSWEPVLEGRVAPGLSDVFSLCRYLTPHDDVLVVPDTFADGRFHRQLHDTGNRPVRFLASCPVIAHAAEPVGFFCLLHDTPRDMTEEDQAFLRDLARLAAGIIERDGTQVRLEEDVDALREGERRMTLAIAGSGTGIWDRDIKAGEIYYSAGWKAILGYTDTEISNRIEDSYTRIHPDDLDYVRAAIRAHFDQQTASYEVEHRIRCKDGHYKWISSRGRVVSRDADGTPLRMIGTTTDVSAIRGLSERLQQTVDLLTNLTNEVPGLVFQYQRTPRGESFFSYASAGIQDMYELTPEQVVADDSAVNRLVHPDDLPGYLMSFDVSAESLAPWHFEYRVWLPRQGLRWRQGDARPVRLSDGSTLWHGFITDITERKRIEAELQEFATVDFLTQLPNRRHFMMQIEAELTKVQRALVRRSAVLMCDLDHFKLINDQWGHSVGDQALRHFAAILRDQLNAWDLAGRVGGEEFAVVLSGKDIGQAAAFAQLLQQRITGTPLLVGGQHIPLTVSVGVSVIMASDASADAALSRGDQALYRAKKNGRNRIECYEVV